MNDEQTRARFEGLMVPLMKEAYNLARWLMRNEEDAQDVVQESYLKAFRFFGMKPWFQRRFVSPWFSVPLALAAALVLVSGL